MPVYRTSPDVSLDELVSHLEWVGEPIITCEHAEDQWVIVTHPAIPKRRPRTTSNALETRS